MLAESDARKSYESFGEHVQAGKNIEAIQRRERAAGTRHRNFELRLLASSYIHKWERAILSKDDSRS